MNSAGPPSPSAPLRGASLPTREQYEEAAKEALRSVTHLPLLALAATVAALIELSLARVGWYGLSDLLDRAELVELHRAARFPRNLAALTGLIALGVGFSAYLRFPGYAPISRRLAVATFAGILLPAIAAATFVPGHYLRERLVVFGLAAANVLVTLLGMSAVRYRSGASLRAALLFATVSSFAVLVVVGVGRLAELEQGPLAPIGEYLARRPALTGQCLLVLRHGAELAWAAVLVFGALRVFAAKPTHRIVPAFMVAVAAVAILGYRALTGHLFRVMLYGAFGLDLLRDDASYLYAVPLGAGLAAGLFALARREVPTRQLGAGLLLWLAAGFGPHTLVQLMYLVLGVLLMVRAAQAYDPEGEWRARHPFLRWKVRFG